jgi:hypothetical protein
MANKKNLKPIKKGELSKEEAKKRGSKGGKRSVEVRRQKKTMKEMLDYLLQQDITNKQGETKNTLEVMMTAQIKEAIKGNTKAAQFVRDTIGEMPTQKVELDSSEVVKQGLNRINEYFGSNQK